MKTIIEESITWGKIGKHPKTEYVYQIERAVISKETNELTVDLRLNFVIPFSDQLKIEAIIKNDIKGLGGVKIQCKYEDMILTTKEIITLFIEHMIHIVNGSYASITKTIFTDKFLLHDDESLTIYALGELSTKLLNKEVAPKFESLLWNNFGITLKVNFENHQELYKEAQGKKEAEEKQAAIESTNISRSYEAKPKTAKKTQYSGSSSAPWGKKTTKESPVVGNRIMGGTIVGEISPLSETQAQREKIVVEGIIFNITERTLKTGSVLMTILITDRKTSACIKMFVTEAKRDDINNHLKVGDAIKVKGKSEFDVYDNTFVIKGQQIEKGEMHNREDNAPRKRVELHAHTKMSAMDGLTDVKTMVKTAESWGHSAVAITDHGVVQSFPDASHAGKNIKILYGVEGYLIDDEGCQNDDGSIDYKKQKTPYHVIILAKNRVGLKNLYKLISYSHLKYFYKKPRIPKSILSDLREGLIIGSACVAGEIYQGILNKKTDEEMKKLAEFYDYLEVQPLVNNQFLINKEIVAGKRDLQEHNRNIIELGKKCGKLVVATCDAHYFHSEEAVYRQILMAGQGYKDIEGDKGLYFRTTEEMLEEFAYLGKETAEKIVIDNPNTIADSIDKMMPVPEGKFPPTIDGSKEYLRNICEQRAQNLYGNPLPEPIRARLDKELNSILDNGYAVMYRSAEMLVTKSMEDGYLVGSRGSVGSSFAATMSGITEVNPLAPHYICPNCKELEWGDMEEYSCGVDMPEKMCPKCGTKYNQEGFTIPFETFLGFEADKEPDIDLNFAGEYQAVAHKYVEEIFGPENVYKAGTIGTIKDKTAYGYVMKYYDEREWPVNKFEAGRLAQCCCGVRRTSGQHPGGIIIVPRGHEIYEFCPVQHPANDTKSDIITTHFDYHSIDQNLLKLDILGHDVPSMIKHLQDMTGVDPLKVPLKDERVNSIFIGTSGLDIKDPDYKFIHGSYGIPEFGTKFTRQMLDDMQPKQFADLVKISGFSHGTDVWINNAQELITSGTATTKDAISTRDDIMNYLRQKGLPNKDAFTIMEKVRKGKGLTPEQEELMKSKDVPQWYIESCKKIQYMFPRAHAVAYVMMSYRIAYYKVYYPVEFYAVYLTTKVDNFDAKTILKGSEAILEKMAMIKAKEKNATKKDDEEVTVMEVAYEMYARGYEFIPATLGISHETRFTTKDGKVVLPFVTIPGLGEGAAKQFVLEYKNKPYETVDDIRQRGKVNKTAIEELREQGVLDGLPETDQLCLF